MAKKISAINQLRPRVIKVRILAKPSTESKPKPPPIPAALKKWAPRDNELLFEIRSPKPNI